MCHNTYYMNSGAKLHIFLQSVHIYKDILTYFLRKPLRKYVI